MTSQTKVGYVKFRGRNFFLINGEVYRTRDLTPNGLILNEDDSYSQRIKVLLESNLFTHHVIADFVETPDGTPEDGYIVFLIVNISYGSEYLCRR